MSNPSQSSVQLPLALFIKDPLVKLNANGLPRCGLIAKKSTKSHVANNFDHLSFHYIWYKADLKIYWAVLGKFSKFQECN